jgi:hypothetical protein
LSRALKNLTSAQTPKGDRALRHVVLSFQNCLGSVPRTERRVLELRAGVGVAHTRSRAQVARITGTTRRHVGRLERRGLHRLRALGRAGTCARGADTATTQVPVATAGAMSPPTSADTARGAGVPTSARTSHGSGESKTSGGESALQTAIERPVIRGLGHTLDLGPLLVAFALGGLTFMIARELRRASS